MSSKAPGPVRRRPETLYRGYFGKLRPAQQIVETILRNCAYLEDVIRSYIDLSRWRSTTWPPSEGGCGSGPGRGETTAVPEIKDNLRRMPIVVEVKEDPPVLGDSQLLKIVVRNLVNNAIKYGREGTPVQVTLERKGGEAVLTVRNEGVGISPEDIQNRLFKKFERLKQKGTEGVKGSGLGLYICKKIVDKHGGRIWAEGEQGILDRLPCRPADGRRRRSGIRPGRRHERRGWPRIIRKIAVVRTEYLSAQGIHANLECRVRGGRNVPPAGALSPEIDCTTVSGERLTIRVRDYGVRFLDRVASSEALGHLDLIVRARRRTSKRPPSCGAGRTLFISASRPGSPSRPSSKTTW